MAVSLRSSIVVRAASLAALALAGAAQSPVLVVDDDGGAGVGYTSLQQAINAAASGSTILVRSGDYGVYGVTVVSGKSLTIAADAGEEPRILGSFEIGSLAAAEKVAIRGLNVVVPLNSAPMRVVAGPGTVLFEDCSFRCANLGMTGGAGAGVIVEASESVAFARCSIEGSLGGYSPGTCQGLIVRNSSVYLYDCVLKGGDGALGGTNDGSDGALIQDGFLFASGGSITGGKGGKGTTLTVWSGTFCSDGGAGGHGIRLEGTTPQALLLDVLLAGAPGGLPGAGYGATGCSAGAPGAPSFAPPGALQTLPGSAHSFAASSPVRELDTATLSFQGEPGEYVLGVLGYAPAAHYVGLLQGALLVDAGGATVVALGPADAAGALALSFALPPLVPAGTALSLLMQPIYLDAFGGATLGGSSGLLVLSATL